MVRERYPVIGYVKKELRGLLEPTKRVGNAMYLEYLSALNLICYRLIRLVAYTVNVCSVNGYKGT